MTLREKTRGDTPSYRLTASRTASSTVPALDLTTATQVNMFARVRGAPLNLFVKTLSDGVTVIDANTVEIQLSESDTNTLTGAESWSIVAEVEIRELDGRVTTKRVGPIPFRADLG